jgi:hypothetical protein
MMMTTIKKKKYIGQKASDVGIFKENEESTIKEPPSSLFKSEPSALKQQERKDVISKSNVILSTSKEQKTAGIKEPRSIAYLEKQKMLVEKDTSMLTHLFNIIDIFRIEKRVGEKEDLRNENVKDMEACDKIIKRGYDLLLEKIDNLSSLSTPEERSDWIDQNILNDKIKESLSNLLEGGDEWIKKNVFEKVEKLKSPLERDEWLKENILLKLPYIIESREVINEFSETVDESITAEIFGLRREDDTDKEFQRERKKMQRNLEILRNLSTNLEQLRYRRRTKKEKNLEEEKLLIMTSYKEIQNIDRSKIIVKDSGEESNKKLYKNMENVMQGIKKLSNQINKVQNNTDSPKEEILSDEEKGRIYGIVFAEYLITDFDEHPEFYNNDGDIFEFDESSSSPFFNSGGDNSSPETMNISANLRNYVRGMFSAIVGQFDCSIDYINNASRVFISTIKGLYKYGQERHQEAMEKGDSAIVTSLRTLLQMIDIISTKLYKKLGLNFLSASEDETLSRMDNPSSPNTTKQYFVFFKKCLAIFFIILIPAWIMIKDTAEAFFLSPDFYSINDPSIQNQLETFENTGMNFSKSMEGIWQNKTFSQLFNYTKSGEPEAKIDTFYNTTKDLSRGVLRPEIKTAVGSVGFTPLTDYGVELQSLVDETGKIADHVRGIRAGINEDTFIKNISFEAIRNDTVNVLERAENSTNMINNYIRSYFLTGENAKLKNERENVIEIFNFVRDTIGEYIKSTNEYLWSSTGDKKGGFLYFTEIFTSKLGKLILGLKSSISEQSTTYNDLITDLKEKWYNYSLSDTGAGQKRVLMYDMVEILNEKILNTTLSKILKSKPDEKLSTFLNDLVGNFTTIGHITGWFIASALDTIKDATKNLLGTIKEITKKAGTVKAFDNLIRRDIQTARVVEAMSENWFTRILGWASSEKTGISTVIFETLMRSHISENGFGMYGMGVTAGGKFSNFVNNIIGGAGYLASFMTEIGYWSTNILKLGLNFLATSRVLLFMQLYVPSVLTNVLAEMRNYYYKKEKTYSLEEIGTFLGNIYRHAALLPVQEKTEPLTQQATGPTSTSKPFETYPRKIPDKYRMDDDFESISENIDNVADIGERQFGENQSASTKEKGKGFISWILGKTKQTLGITISSLVSFSSLISVYSEMAMIMQTVSLILSIMSVMTESWKIVGGVLLFFTYYAAKYGIGERGTLAFPGIIGGFGLIVLFIEGSLGFLFPASVILQVGVKPLLIGLFSFGFSITAVASTPKLIYTKYINCIMTNSIILGGANLVLTNIPIIGGLFSAEKIANLQIAGSLVEFYNGLTYWYIPIFMLYSVPRLLMAMRAYEYYNEARTKGKDIGFSKYVIQSIGEKLVGFDYSEENYKDIENYIARAEVDPRDLRRKKD